MVPVQILVVEDDAELGGLVVTQLSKAGFAARLATDGIEAMRLMVQSPPRLVILDFNFPAGGGGTLHERIRSSSATAAVPIMMFTSTPPQLVKQALKSDERTYYLGKPFKQGELLNLVAGIMAGAARPLSAMSAARKAGRPQALVADDDAAVADVLKHVLEKEGFEVEVAADGTQLMDRLRLKDLSPDEGAYRPDLIVLDIMMPGIDGFTLNLHLQHNPRTKDIPVVVLTSRPGMKAMFQSASNVLGVMEKPFELATLRGFVAKALRR